MKIYKRGKLPKLKNVKYKCGDCGSIFAINDKDVLRNIYTLGTSDMKCPVCANTIFILHSQYRRVHKYKSLQENL